MVEVRKRSGVRVILVDPDDRVLLIQGCDPHHPEVTYWYTAGGEIEPVESPVDAAVREVLEETGLAIDTDDLVGPVHRDVVTFGFEGRVFEQSNVYYLVRCAAHAAVATALQPHEERSVLAMRWWPLADLHATDERIYPAELAALTTRLIAAPTT